MVSTQKSCGAIGPPILCHCNGHSPGFECIHWKSVGHLDVSWNRLELVETKSLSHLLHPWFISTYIADMLKDNLLVNLPAPAAQLSWPPPSEEILRKSWLSSCISAFWRVGVTVVVSFGFEQWVSRFSLGGNWISHLGWLFSIPQGFLSYVRYPKGVFSSTCGGWR